MTARPTSPSGPRMGRRALLISGASVAATAALAPLARRLRRRPVFIARHQQYDHRLTQTIEDGLQATDVDLAALRGRKVLLKPNMVEPRRDAPHMTTHPMVILAAVEVFRKHGAEVTVGECAGEWPEAGPTSTALASPKSSTRARPSGAIRTLAGLRSRWTTPLS